MKFNAADHDFMELALSLAAKGFGKTQPNPLVGCVIVKGGKIIGQGYHQKYGSAHAEVNALKSCKVSPKGATVYVTLDPCNHIGKTGKCTEALMKAKVGKVISATDDPHDTKHEGEKLLKKNGIQFQRGLLADESRLLLQPYLKNFTKKLPYVILKVATTLDGKIATASGFSKGITSKESNVEVHKLRSAVDGVVTGSGTILADDSHLGVRLVKGRDPVRILLDSSLASPLSSKIFRDEHVIVFTTTKAPASHIDALRAKDIDVIVSDSDIKLTVVLKELFARNIFLLMVEAGSTLMTSFLNEGLVDRYVQFIAPKLLGGENSPTSFEGKDLTDFSMMKELKNVAYSSSGTDFCVDGFLRVY